MFGENKDKFTEEFAKVEDLTNITDEDIYISIICRPSNIEKSIVDKYKNFNNEYIKIMADTGGKGVSKPINEYLPSSTNPIKIK